MAQDVSTLVRGCLRCMMTRAGEVIPRPLGSALHGSKPNEVIHMDFLFMGPGRDEKKYILIIRDDLSSYIWLWPTAACTSEAAADALCVWLGVLGNMVWLVTDQGSHFKNRLLAALISEIKVHHHFTTAYSPWANGSVERVCREVLRATRALLSEWGLAPKDWPAVTECVQSVLNHAPLKRLGPRDLNVKTVYRTPLEVFTGHLPVRPLLRAIPLVPFMEAMPLDELRARQLIDIDRTQAALVHFHRGVAENAEASRKRMIEKHNARTNVHAADFCVGDFVLVRRAVPGKHKLNFKWVGPRRVTAVQSEWVYQVEDLLKQKRAVVHARRLLLYRADMDGKIVSPRLLKAAERSETNYEVAQTIRTLCDREGGLMVQVEWEGLPDSLDFTWEPLERVFEDLPGMLEDFLHTAGDRDLKLRALEQCSLAS